MNSGMAASKATMVAVAPPKLSDRVERAIDDRDRRGGARADARARSGRRLITGAFWLTVCGVSLYLVGPTVLDTLDEADRVRGIAPGWLAAMAGLQLLSCACLWDLQRIALRTRDMTSVATSQLAGNALAKVAPGGGAMGAALQYRMLVQSGLPRASLGLGADRHQPAGVRRGAGTAGPGGARRSPAAPWTTG